MGGAGYQCEACDRRFAALRQKPLEVDGLNHRQDRRQHREHPQYRYGLGKAGAKRQPDQQRRRPEHAGADQHPRSNGGDGAHSCQAHGLVGGAPREIADARVQDVENRVEETEQRPADFLRSGEEPHGGGGREHPQ